MERSYMKADALVELDFITEQHIAFHSHENFELLFVISGKLAITVGEDTYQLGPGDMIVVNVNRKHSYHGSQDMAAGRFLISYTKVRELLGQTHVLFWCNSTIDHNEAYDELRRIIAKLFNQYLCRNEKNKLYASSMYYQMLHILTENFLVTAQNRQYEEDDSGKDDRIQKVFEYIRANYRQNITLEDIASHLYLSPMYTSKFIKQQCKINFSELLNTVRLNRSMEDLIYSDDPVTKIAMENGFASVAAYNKVFKENYEMTPSQFRKERRPRHRQEGEKEKQEKALIERRIQEFLEGHGDVREPESDKLTADLDLDGQAVGRWDNYCCHMINAGAAADLLDSSVQEQILSCKNKMGFEYVRFWDIYAPELHMDIHAAGERQNYSRLNMVTDFLVKNHLKPYIELGFKPVRLLRTTDRAVKELGREQSFTSEDEMRGFYRNLIHNFTNRYGSEEVAGWYFEYWERTNVKYTVSGSYHYTTMAAESHRDYFRRFSLIAGTFRKRLPRARIGGGGFPVRMYGENGFAQMLTVWKQEPEKPDFISLSCYPYIQEMEDNSYYEKRSSDFKFVLHNIQMARNAMEKAGFPEKELHVSEYSLSLSNRNIVNDSCLKGAFLVYNAIACIGKAKMMGHWLFTDAYASEQDATGPLFGGNGLLTKDGITKPAYYAMEFLNMLSPNILQVHPNYMITRSEHGSLRMVCHNMKKPNYHYYMIQEDGFEIQDMTSILENRELLAIHLKIDHIQKGTYLVKQNRLNQSHGSVQDQWADLNMEANLTMREMEYLRSASVSSISIRQVDVTKDVLEFDIRLEPNEIQYIHILQK